MVDTQGNKYVNVCAPDGLHDNTSLTILSPGYVDTFGFHQITYILQLGATDIALTAFKLTECDTTGGSYTDVSGADFSVSPLTLPTATDDNHLFGIFCAVSGVRKRYQKLVVTFGDGSSGGYGSVLAILSNPDNAPYNATTRGLTQQAIIT